MTAGDSQFTRSQVPHWLHRLSERRPLSVPEKPPDTASTWKGHEAGQALQREMSLSVDAMPAKLEK